jgi:hypothetical protein
MAVVASELLNLNLHLNKLVLMLYLNTYSGSSKQMLELQAMLLASRIGRTFYLTMLCLHRYTSPRIVSNLPKTASNVHDIHHIIYT